MTLATTGLVAVAAILAVTAATAGALALGATRAQGAADASALAAAADARDRRALGLAYRGQPDPNGDAPPCLAARAVAARWGAALAACVVGARGVVTVEVSVDVGPGEVSATAKAGPRSW